MSPKQIYTLKALVRTEIGGEGSLQAYVEQVQDGKGNGTVYKVSIGSCECVGKDLSKLVQEIERKVHVTFLEPYHLDCSFSKCVAKL